MFKIGYRSFATEADLEIAKRVGIDTIELMWFDEPGSKGRKDEILRNLDKYEINVSSITTVMGNDPEGLKADIDFAASIGVKAYVAHPPALSFADTSAWEEFKRVWTPAAEYARERGVWLCLHSCGLNRESWDIMFSLVDNIGMKYDPSFSDQAGYSYVDEIAHYGSKIKHIHIKDEITHGRTTDFERGILPRRYVPAGMGDMKWGSVIAMLYEVGYEGDFAIETHSAYWSANMERDLVISKRHLEQFIV